MDQGALERGSVTRPMRPDIRPFRDSRGELGNRTDFRARSELGARGRGNWNGADRTFVQRDFINNNWRRPYYNWHHNHGGWWFGFSPFWNPPWFWGPGAFATGLAFGWLFGPGDTIVYANPYFVPSGTVIYDYVQPIPVAPEALPPPKPNPPEGETSILNYNVPEDVARDFASARAAFTAGDYELALRQIDDCIKALPSDGVAHEFRALVLFAKGNYRDAAATLYAVLAAGPGWDWATLKGLYPDMRSYTAQLRALEEYARRNPNAADARFVLAYHYLTMGYSEQARSQYEQVAKLQPDNRLASQLVKSLQLNADPDRPAPGGG